MKKPWHIWALYSLCLLVVVPAMVWLSLQALELERVRENDRLQTELARREAELQERVSSALWRMDGLLMNLVAREATRPWYLYQPFYDIAPVNSKPVQLDRSDIKPTADGRYQQASPLLFQPSEFVVLHFQIGSDNQITSPQRPEGLDRQQAANCCGLTDEVVDSNTKKMEQVAAVCNYDSMLMQCSTAMLPDDVQTLANNASSDPAAGNPVAQSGLDVQVDSSGGQIDDNLAQALAANARPEFNFFSPPPQQEAQQKEVQQRPQTRQGESNYQMVPKQQVQQSRNMYRGVNEYGKRRQSADSYAMQEWVSNNRLEPQMAGAISTSQFVREGVMRPLWIADRLILARRVVKEAGEVIIQCCWLDWERIQQTLRNEVQDVLPEVAFQAIRNPDEVRWGEALATLPVQLEIDRQDMLTKLELDAVLNPDNSRRSGIRMSLILAWCGLVFAAVAGAFLLQGVIRLSERRGAFVSAVSHELRTPLTTFRMYAEMLAEKMVPAERQQQYAQTLKVESERLSHLVENVLQFARLERSNQKSRLESVTLAGLLDRFQDRLQGRADRASMKLCIDIPGSVLKHSFQTDPVAIEQILFNLVDNACKYAKDADDKRIELTATIAGSQMQIAVRDYGPGVSKSDQHRMFQPFRKSDQDAANTAQGVGLGLALCRRMAKSLGGRLTLGDTETGATLILEIPCG